MAYKYNFNITMKALVSQLYCRIGHQFLTRPISSTSVIAREFLRLIVSDEFFNGLSQIIKSV